ncbi:hypothetical protein Bca52824_084074 [Brassica carinata]|uniref:Uncharacterized protein n=1 Tax=Brassica carinata TaxID=52824 RepID=A0A8X7PNJ4_BRACI|nr:hypothetical protein Bca52824_084074 [Brassica carinata]
MVDRQSMHRLTSAALASVTPILLRAVGTQLTERKPFMKLKLANCYKLEPSFLLKASCMSTVHRRVSVQRVHLAQNRDVVLKLQLFVHPSQVSRVFISSDFVTGAIRLQGPFYLFVSFKSRTFILSGSVEIHLVSSWNLDVGARAIHACSTSFQTLPFGLINVGTDYFMLVVVTYSGIHHMLPIWFSNGRARLTRFALLSLVLIFCFMMFIKPSRIPPVLILSQLSIAPDVIV